MLQLTTITTCILLLALQVSGRSLLSKATGIDININKHINRAIGIDLERTAKAIIHAPKKQEHTHFEGTVSQPMKMSELRVEYIPSHFQSDNEHDMIQELSNLGLSNAELLAKFATLSMTS